MKHCDTCLFYDEFGWCNYWNQSCKKNESCGEHKEYKKGDNNNEESENE